MKYFSNRSFFASIMGQDISRVSPAFSGGFCCLRKRQVANGLAASVCSHRKHIGRNIMRSLLTAMSRRGYARLAMAVGNMIANVLTRRFVDCSTGLLRQAHGVQWASAVAGMRRNLDPRYRRLRAVVVDVIASVRTRRVAL